ncbi:MAG: sulfatase-like hydrolase/transferase [Myxococcales bacterium]|nr:sulfatase-like hydrolase/transferase [Myxococcales bacterium]
MTLRNLSDEPISEASGDRLAYHWRDRSGAIIHHDGRRTRLPEALAPGEAVTLDALLEAPSAPGSYLLQWEPVREQRGWYGPPRRSRSLLIPVEVIAGAPPWRLLSEDVPRVMSAGALVEAKVRLENLGPKPWDPAAGDRLSYRWRDPEGALVVRDGLRSALPRPVAVGEAVEVTLTIRAPARPGPRTLHVEPLREGERWYGDLAPAIAVEVATPARAWGLAAAAPLGELHGGEVVEVGVVLENLGEEVIDPAAGDRLSYHWLSAEGDLVIWNGRRSDLDAPLLPGESRAIAAQVVAPVEPGRYRLVWALVREGEGWTPASRDDHVEAPVEVAPPWLAFEIDEVRWPRWLPAAGEGEVEVRVRNTGAATWSAAAGDRLSYHWLDAAGEGMIERQGRRTPIPEEVPPGGSVTVPLRVSGPGVGGELTLAIDMVREHVAWYGEPPSGPPPRSRVRVVWRSGLWQVAFIALFGALAAGLRRWRPPAGARRWLLVDLGPALFTFAATWLLIHTFADLSGIALWRGAEELAPASAALPVIALLAAPSAWRGGLGALWIALIALLGLADLVYLHFLGSIVPVHALTAAHQVGDIAASVRAVLDPSYVWLLPLPLAAIALALAWPRRRPEDAPPGRWRWGGRLVSVLAALVVAWPFVAEIRGIMASDLGKRVFSEQRNVARLGLVGVHIFDVARAVRERRGRGEASADEVAALREVYRERASLREAAAEALPGRGIARGHDLLLIQIESLQAWVIGAEVDGQEITPFLNRLQGRGLFYSKIADVAAQGMTSDAEYATLNSAYPLAQGAIAFLRADNEFVTIAHALAAAGYATWSAHPYKRGFWNRAVLHPRYGFARSLFARELGPGPKIAWGLADDAFFDRALAAIAEGPRPFFGFLITLSVHHPYESFPDERKVLELGRLEGTATGNYLHGMRAMDAAVAGLFADLEARGLADHTLVAIYGDHDARLGASPEVLALAGIPRWTPAVPALIERVPVFIVPAGGELHGEVDRVGSLVDVAPTLLHLLGVATPGSFIGQPLLPGPGPDLGVAAYADGSALAADHLYVAGGREIGRRGACFTASGGDPRPLEECHALASAAAALLAASRAVVDFDLARALAEGGE